MTKKRVIAYLHTHWDREWYREFEIFRMRLLRVFDEVLDALERDLIPSFYFDGQVVALLDYLKMRPQNENRVRALIKSERLFIGPFYCLVDEFLTSEKLFSKNLEYGLKISKEFGCKKFTGYLADTFGHSDGVIKLLKRYGIESALVWRGCGKVPSEFVWRDVDGESINAINLVRGYFMDIFTADLGIEQKVKFLKTNLDKIAEKSGDILLLPIGADHLGIPVDIKKQIENVNAYLEDYQIELGSIFDYIDAIRGRHVEEFRGELRDNSETFTLEGSYSSRVDLKRLNIICTHKLERAEKFVEFYGAQEKYSNLLEYAYKLLLKNQAHDSICGCSTDDVHEENLIRYKKIQQITDTIISEIKFEKGLFGKIVNLSGQVYEGVVCAEKYEIGIEDIVLSESRGFREELLADIKRIPITEDYLPVYNVLDMVVVGQGENVNNSVEPYVKVVSEEAMLSNDKITLRVTDKIEIVSKSGVASVVLKDFNDFGDSYNRGCVRDDSGRILAIKSCRNIFNSPLRSILEISYENVRLELSLDANCDYPLFSFEIDNRGWKNHHLFMCLETSAPVSRTISEDMNRLIERDFKEYEGNPISLLNPSVYWNIETPNSIDIESMEDVINRVEECLNKIKKEYPNKNILIIAHSGICRAIKYIVEGKKEKDLSKYEMKNLEVYAYKEW